MVPSGIIAAFRMVVGTIHMAQRQLRPRVRLTLGSSQSESQSVARYLAVLRGSTTDDHGQFDLADKDGQHTSSTRGLAGGGDSHPVIVTPSA